MSPPYPSASEVKQIFELENHPSGGDREAFLSHVDDNFHLVVMSDAHPFPRQANKEEYGQIMEMQEEWMHADADRPYEKSVGVVTGGGENEWVAVEIKNHGVTKAGEFFVVVFWREGERERGGGERGGKGFSWDFPSLE